MNQMGSSTVARNIQPGSGLEDQILSATQLERENPASEAGNHRGDAFRVLVEPAGDFRGILICRLIARINLWEVFINHAT